MAFFAVNQRLTPQWSLEQDLRAWQQAEVPGLGLLRSKLQGKSPQEIKALLEQHARSVVSLHHVGGFTGSDGRRFRESVEDAQAGLRLAAQLGASCVVVYSGARGGHTYNHAKRLFRDGLQELAPLAQQLELDLAVESVHPSLPQQLTFLCSLEEVLEILDRVDHPRVKLVLDLYHLGGEAELVQRIPELVSRIALVQLADAPAPSAQESSPQAEQRLLPGEGSLPVQELVAALRQAGYQGPWELELCGPRFTSQDPVEVLQKAKRSFEQLMQGIA